MDGKAVVQDAQGNIIYPCGYKGGAKERSVSEPVFEENEVAWFIHKIMSLDIYCRIFLFAKNRENPIDRDFVFYTLNLWNWIYFTC
jgi:hypothetical protein